MVAMAVLAVAFLAIPGGRAAATGRSHNHNHNQATHCSQVIHLGDSTTVGMGAALADAYESAGFDAHTSAGNGRGISFRVSPDRETGLQAATRLRHELAGAGQLCWVVALGTNDAAYLDHSADRQRSIDDLLDVIAGDPVLWVDVYMFAPHSRRGGHARCDGPASVFGCYGATNTREWNHLLATTAAAHPNMTVYDWAGLVRYHPDWFQNDGIHYTSAGYAERATRIAAAASATFR
jgi:hypothetical protein